MKDKHKVPEFLIVKGEEFETALNADGETVSDFADALDIEMTEAYGILSGEKVGSEISRRFINHYGADHTHKYIDWEAMGMTDPYEKIKKRCVKTRYYDRRSSNKI